MSGAARVRAFIFDLDGTLVDSLADIAAAMNHALEASGWRTHGLEAYRQFIGEGVDMLARRAAPAGIDDVHRAALVIDYQRRYAEHLFDATVPYPGVVEVVAELRRRKRPMAVLSNKPDLPTRHLAEALFPVGSFVAIQGQREGVPKKPDPTAALALADAMGCKPAEVLFVGDTTIDIATARAAGMPSVGVAWGFRPDELAAVARVISRPEELLTMP